jgi:hypothetical protein
MFRKRIRNICVSDAHARSASVQVVKSEARLSKESLVFRAARLGGPTAEVK